MCRYALRLEYLGTNFSGSQKQPDTRTVQGELEKALCTLTKTNISTIFSGRTDSGVSARSQCAHFDCPKIVSKEKFLYSLNGILPEDIRVFSLDKVDKTFHAQKSAKFRHYRYVIRNAPAKSVFDVTTAYTRYSLSENRMNDALMLLQGVHDFSAYKSKSDNPASICNLYYTNARRSVDGNYIIIDIIGDRFLYNMVRTIVGTLLMIEKDCLEPLTMQSVLNSKSRQLAGPCAPPEGLVLEYVGYGDCSEYINTLKNKLERQINENI